MALDTGSEVTVIKPGEAKQFPLDTTVRKSYRSASKHPIVMDGTKEVETADGILRCAVGDVSRNLLSAFDLLETKHRVILDSDGCFAMHKPTGRKLKIVQEGKGFRMDFKLKAASSSSSSSHPNGFGGRRAP